MEKIILFAQKNLKVFFEEKTNVIIALLLVMFGLNIFAILEVQNVKKNSDDNFKNLEKFIDKRCEDVDDKVDFRYFNLTRSIQDIHGVNIDTKRGNVVSRFKIVD